VSKHIVIPTRGVISGILIGILFLISLATWQAVFESRSAREWSRHSLLVLGAIKDLDVAVNQTETGERGYLLTGEEEYLAPYKAAGSRVTELYENLQSLTADNPGQQALQSGLAIVLQHKLDMLGQAVQTRNEAGFDAALRLVHAGQGRNLMVQIEATLAAMTAAEQTLLATRTADTDRRSNWGRVLTLGGTIFAVLTLFWSSLALEAAATTDALTGLLSRNGLWLLLDARNRRRKPTRAALLRVDLDRFRAVNQSFGPLIGDKLLVEVGRRLTQIAGKSRVARLGGDDFAIYCTGITPADTARLGDSAITVLSRPFDLEGHSFYLTASVGVADTDTAAALNLWQGADEALHVAKQQGGNQSVAFVQSMHDARKQLSELEQDLHSAIDREGELYMAYQPVVRIADRMLVGIEALARWNHPRLGLIPPQRFIELAETRGLILPVGLKLATLAIRQAALWHAQYPGQCPVININVSPVQFATGDVIADLVKLLRQHDLPASAFCIEVTEGAFADAGAIQALQTARQIGFMVAMDDFGVGYSSLAQLPRLPLSSVKLDRSFIVYAQRAHDGAMLAAIMQLAHALTLEVIAEGVETQDQLDLVAGCGCDAVQGYYYAQPLTPEGLGIWLSGKTRPAIIPASLGTVPA